MTNRERAEPIAALSRDLQIALMREAARRTEKRSVRGNSLDRFYVHECGLSPAVVQAMRAEGHGEKIYSGRGSNAGRCYFPVEILDHALVMISSAHGRLELRTLALRA